MKKSYFITGTDTGVGKTIVSCALLHRFAASGQRVVGMKPIVAGCEQGHWLDVDLLRSASNVSVTPAQMNPYAFIPPIAPHIAAQQSGISIDLSVIQKRSINLQEMADVVIAEGAGGFLVPLDQQRDGADLVRAVNFPVILVVGMRLGCLNHALLSVQAIRVSGQQLVGWVANCVDPDMLELELNIETLKQRLGCPLLGVLPYTKNVDTKQFSTLLDISVLT